jgi:hypothetical protein
MQAQAHANLATISNTGLNDEVGVPMPLLQHWQLA